jgi:mannose-6-phosphate isomerase class I
LFHVRTSLVAGAGDAGYVQVLSVAKALSIQAHPDKKRAEALHALRPSVYKDDNHKPEMAIAITEFRALYGFAAIQVLTIYVSRTMPTPHLAPFDPSQHNLLLPG